MMRLVDKTPRKGDGHLKFLLWSEYHHEWIEVFIRPEAKLGNDVDRLPKDRAFTPKEKPVDEEAKAARIARLRPYMKKGEPLPPSKPDGKRCTFGMIGDDKVLIDAGNGEVLGKYNPANFDAEKEAKKLKRTLVSQKDAAPQAMVALRRAWTEARAKIKGGK